MLTQPTASLKTACLLLAVVTSACGTPTSADDASMGPDGMGRQDGGDASATLEDTQTPDSASQPTDAETTLDASALDAMDLDVTAPNDARDARDARDASATTDAANGRDVTTMDSATDAGVFRSSTRQTARMLGDRMAPSGFYEYLPPNYDMVTPTPLLVFWHGIGENGNGTTELTRVLNNGVPRLIAQNQWPASRPFVVLSPQHPGGGCPTANEIQAFIAWAITNYRVDPARIYLTGLSCGAIGSWNYLGAHVDAQVAAAVLIAGDGRGAWGRQMCNLGRVPIWGFHGDADGTVSVDGTRMPMTSLIACPSPPRKDARMTIYPGVGHDSWSRTYNLSAGHDIYAWLLSQRR
ncbi:MAG: PHB depolymerase family esterase [Deltaproteobacteria bacterium]|nr:PHB depolymerase family esterase [Deltaproteobacteria bacterium]